MAGPAPAGTVLKIECNPGDTVEEGDTVLVLEAMKMESPIAAPMAGKVQEILVNNGDNVPAGTVLFTIA